MKLRPGPLDPKTDVRRLLDRFEEMKAERAHFEPAWDQISQWVDPRHDFAIDRVEGQLRRRQLVDTTAPDSAFRLAALLYGFMISPYDPWTKPYAVNLGRAPNYEEKRWFETVQQEQHEFLTATRSSFRTNSLETLNGDVTYGTSILWMGLSRQTGQPFFKALPLRECWIAENDEGVVDTLVRRFTLTLRQAVKAFPTPELVKKTEGPKVNWSEDITFLWLVMPREDGREGALSLAKPFASIVLCESTQNEIAKEEGFEDFPFAVTRFEKKSGEAYGRAPGWRVLPNAKFLNAMKETILRAAEQEADPALIDLTGEYASLDTRPGALNSLPAGDLGLMNPDQIVRRVVERSELGLTVELVRDVKHDIEVQFFTDWMSIGDGAHVTAEFVRDRRDLRLRGLSPIVSRGEAEKLQPVSERSFTLMQRANMLPRPPKSLDKAQVGWDYDSPLARAQKGSRVEAAERSLLLAERCAQLDPESLDEINVPAILSDAVSDAGLMERHKRSPDEIKARRAKREANEQARADAEQAEIEARALSSAGQGVSNLMQTGQV